jgi:type I restriction enzyme, S subunit
VRSVTVIRPVHLGISVDFLALHLMSKASQSEIWREVKQSAQPCLYLAKSAALKIALPPLAEQSRIVTRVEELMRLCDALEAKGQLEAVQHAQLISTLLATLTESDTPTQLAENWQRVASHFDLLLDRPQAVDALEQTILQIAVRGLLVPQDPQDEPASALLEKIRTEKDKLIADGKIKRDKPLQPIAEDEQRFALPPGWEWVPVGDVVEMLNGYAFKSEWFKKAGTRLLRNVNVAHGYVDWSTPAFIDSVLASGFDQFALNEGDVVLTLDRPIISTGLKLAVLQKHDLPCLLLQRVARLSPVPQSLSQEYLVLWLQSDAFVGTLDPGRSNGVPHISTKQVASMAFPLPPIAEQSRIVTRVTALRQLCAELRTRLLTSQSTQAQLAEALVQEVA